MKVGHYSYLNYKIGNNFKSRLVYKFIYLGDFDTPYIGKMEQLLFNNIKEYNTTNSTVFKYTKTEIFVRIVETFIVNLN